MATAPTADVSTDLRCDCCGYDLRAHPLDGKCPECGESVAESQRLAAIPRRPDWRDSDPRWRRRMLAGAWILVLMPLMDALRISGWDTRVHVPNVFNLPGGWTLDESFLSIFGVYQSLFFCTGVVLLFSKERGRRRSRLDWTRRWGVICSYVTLLLSAAPILFISALVLTGIAAMFISMPLKYQPGVTKLFIDVSVAYLRHGPYPKDISGAVLVAISSIAILLACVPLFDALRSSGRKRFAAILLAPLVLFALINLGQAILYCAHLSNQSLEDVYSFAWYFRPGYFLAGIAALDGGATVSQWLDRAFVVEGVKWCIVLAIAMWLSIAQFSSWRQRRKASAS